MDANEPTDWLDRPDIVPNKNPDGYTLYGKHHADGTRIQFRPKRHCVFCDKVFRNESFLMQHLQRKHSGRKINGHERIPPLKLEPHQPKKAQARKRPKAEKRKPGPNGYRLLPKCSWYCVECKRYFIFFDNFDSHYCPSRLHMYEQRTCVECENIFDYDEFDEHEYERCEQCREVCESEGSSLSSDQDESEDSSESDEIKRPMFCAICNEESLTQRHLISHIYEHSRRRQREDEDRQRHIEAGLCFVM